MRKFVQFLIFFTLLAALTSLGMALRYQSAYPKRLGPVFDEQVRTKHRDNLNEHQPVVVLMGDSTLRESVDFELLSRHLGVEAYGVAVPGSTTALWYLVLKNNILPAEHHPQYLVLFTRETLLTTPEYRVDGRYFPTIDEFAGPDEELLRERSYLNQMSPLEQVAARYLPLYGERTQFRESIDYRIDHTLPLLLGCDQACVSRALRIVFSGDVYADAFIREQDMVDTYLWGIDKLLFERQLPRSYLPEIVRMTQENGIQLILVEVKTWVSPGSSTISLLREAYLRDLRKYAAEHDIVMISFADDPRLPRQYFFDHFHLEPQSIPVFTRLLAQELKKYIY